jgi:hypothetical protein
LARIPEIPGEDEEDARDVDGELYLEHCAALPYDLDGSEE